MKSNDKGRNRVAQLGGAQDQVRGGTGPEGEVRLLLITLQDLSYELCSHPILAH